MNERLKSLYQTVILQKSREDKYVGKLNDFSLEFRAYNPMCGDEFDLQILIEDNRFKCLKYSGSGCSISKASAAVLCEHLEGVELDTVRQKVELFLELVDADSDKQPEELTDDENLLAFAAARDFPERKTCADLSWKELLNQLDTLNQS